MYDSTFALYVIPDRSADSGISTDAAAYHHDVYAAHFNLRCFREKICITMRYYVCAITDGKLDTSDADDEEMTALI
ncbi:hypothetical protein T06_2642 [Trichinella sp. T6]|nr:hypothetical protein T06_2642 [Trichinella sp. T6]